MDPVPDPILPEKFLGYSRESNLGPLGWQSDVLTTIPNRWSFIDMECIIFILAVPTQATKSTFYFLHLAQRLHFFLGMCSVSNWADAMCQSTRQAIFLEFPRSSKVNPGLDFLP